MYMFNADDAGDTVRNALAAAARRGVDVKLLIDGSGPRHRHEFFASSTRPAASIACSTRATAAATRSESSEAGGDRRAVAMIGGANIDDTYLTDRGPEQWRDLWLRIEGPEARSPSRYFDLLFRWVNASDSSLKYAHVDWSAKYSEWRGPLQWKFTRSLEPAQQLVADDRPGHAARPASWT